MFDLSPDKSLIGVKARAAGDDLLNLLHKAKGAKTPAVLTHLQSSVAIFIQWCVTNSLAIHFN